jgi:hypothetical protein
MSDDDWDNDGSASAKPSVANDQNNNSATKPSGFGFAKKFGDVIF